MQTKNYNILLIEDNKIDAHLVKKILATSESAKFVLQHVSRLAPGLELLSREEFDLVMVDLGLPDSYGLNTLIQVIHQAPETPAIVFTSNDDQDAVSQAVMQGAQDYLVKGQFDKNSLIRSIRYAIERHRAEQVIKIERDLAHAILDTVSDLVVVLDTQGHIIRFNRACQQLTGYTPADIWDTYIWDIFVAPQEVALFKSFFLEIRESQKAGEFQHYCLSKDGRRLLVKWAGTTLRDRQGRVKYFIMTGSQIADIPTARGG